MRRCRQESEKGAASPAAVSCQVAAAGGQEQDCNCQSFREIASMLFFFSPHCFARPDQIPQSISYQELINKVSTERVTRTGVHSIY